MTLSLQSSNGSGKLSKRFGHHGGIYKHCQDIISLLGGVALYGVQATYSPANHMLLSIRLKQFHKIFVWQMYRWKGLFVGFLSIYSVLRSMLWFTKK